MRIVDVEVKRVPAAVHVVIKEYDGVSDLILHMSPPEAKHLGEVITRIGNTGEFASYNLGATVGLGQVKQL